MKYTFDRFKAECLEFLTLTNQTDSDIIGCHLQEVSEEDDAFDVSLLPLISAIHLVLAKGIPSISSSDIHEREPTSIHLLDILLNCPQLTRALFPRISHRRRHLNPS